MEIVATGLGSDGRGHFAFGSVWCSAWSLWHVGDILTSEQLCEDAIAWVTDVFLGSP